jgi:hypothetical protein
MIVTKAVWEKTQAILLEKSKAPEKENNTHMFTGMVWCHCGQKMKVVSEGAKLDCPACHGKIPAGDIEAIFVEDFFDVTSSCPSLAAAMSAPSERRELQAELVDVSTALEEAKAAREGVERMLTSSSISQKRFEELHGPLEKKVRNLEFRLHAVQQKLAGNSPPGFSLPEWQKQWAAWPVKRKRQLLSTFVGRVTVHAGEIEIAYRLSDSSSKDATQPQQIMRPTNHPQISSTSGGPQYIRLPKPGEKCPITGLSRAKLNELILPNERNHFNPPVASKSLRKPGSTRGIRLVLLESLLTYLAGKV